eukprot:SAG31_NODE_37720_length_302_cov_0.522167_1_plen_69_part_10
MSESVRSKSYHVCDAQVHKHLPNGQPDWERVVDQDRALRASRGSDAGVLSDDLEALRADIKMHKTADHR